MKSQFEREYYDFQQSVRDREDELAQNALKAEKIRRHNLRDLTRLLKTSDDAVSVGVSPEDIAAVWKEYPRMKPITDFLFASSKETHL